VNEWTLEEPQEMSLRIREDSSMYTVAKVLATHGDPQFRQA
jgi:hypothetical protein